MPNVINYATQFDNQIRSLYDQELFSTELFNTNMDVKFINAKTLKLPTLKVSGYKDHTRGGSFNAGTYENDYETKTLDHDRDIEIAVDPMDVDETNQVVSTANFHARFEKTQAIPELDCYTFSKLHAEYLRAGGTAKTTALTTANVLSDFDDNCEIMKDAGVPLNRVILYCTSTYEKLLKNADGITRMMSVNGGNQNINRMVNSIDDLGKIKVVPKERLMTLYNFTSGYAADATGKQMDYIMIDPEAQVSRVKYSYIHMFAPGSDSRTADNYLYQNRRYNGTFALMDADFKKGCIIHEAA
jgi:hypothetical protein